MGSIFPRRLADGLQPVGGWHVGERELRCDRRLWRHGHAAVDVTIVNVALPDMSGALKTLFSVARSARVSIADGVAATFAAVRLGAADGGVAIKLMRDRVVRQFQPRNMPLMAVSRVSAA